MAVKIDGGGCIGCGACAANCPVEAIAMVDGIAVVDPEKCIECGACVGVCPVQAITMPGGEQGKASLTDETKEERPVPAENAGKTEQPVPAGEVKVSESSAQGSGVWVFIEQMEGQAAPVSWELLGEGRKLADKLGVELAGIILGSETGPLAAEAFAYGADTVYLVEHPVLAKYRTQPYAEALVDLAGRYSPDIFLMGATTLGRDLSGRVATALETGLTADCTVLEISREGLLEQTRPAFGGNIMATILCRKHRPQMATVRPRVMAMPPKVEGRQGRLIRETVNLDESRVKTRVVEYIKEGTAAVYLDKAEIIVAGGRGIGSAKNWRLVEELARTVGGTVGASRAAVEAGWIPVAHQVGQTGQTVRPRIYFALGISGAIQHLVGMQGSDTIIAVNNDPEAPIFKVATYGIVGDINVVIPEMIEQLRKRFGVSSE